MVGVDKMNGPVSKSFSLVDSLNLLKLNRSCALIESYFITFGPARPMINNKIKVAKKPARISKISRL